MDEFFLGERNAMMIAVVLANVGRGGTLRHTTELVKAWENQGHELLFIELMGRVVRVNVINQKSQYVLSCNEGYILLEDILKKYHVQILHIEHLIGMKKSFFEMIFSLNIPIVITLHDYYTICPFIQLTNEKSEYCQEKGNVECNQCLKKRKFHSFELEECVTNISKWRMYWENYLNKADLVLVPSVDTQQRILRYYPKLNIQVAEDPEVIQYRSEKRQIGLIGNLSVSKGAGKVKECLQYCVKYQMNLHFVLFGTLEGIELTEDEEQYITVLGPYKESEIYSLISRYFIDFFWFPGIWPETYSYTLSIPIRLRIPCISTDLGAIAARIHEHHWGSTYSWDADASRIIKELIRFPYEKFYNPVFKITNTTFGTIESYYGDVLKKIPTEKANSLSTENVIIPNVFSHINGVLTRDEFTLLWQSASLLQKVILLRHIDCQWLKNVLKQKGIKYFYKKLKEKL